MLRDVEVDDLPPTVADHEEAIDYAEGDRWDREKIHRRDSFPMVVQEREPTFGGLRISRRSFDPAWRSLTGLILLVQEK